MFLAGVDLTPREDNPPPFGSTSPGGRERVLAAAEGPVLAEWCGKRGLEAQQRAHLTRVLELDPDHAAVREQLGFRQVDNIWLNPEEIEKSEERAKEAVDDLAGGDPRSRGFSRA